MASEIFIPTPDDYARVTRQVDALIKTNGGNYRTYFRQSWNSRSTRNPVHMSLAKTADILVPRDRTTGEVPDNAQEYINASLLGFSAAVACIYELHGPQPIVDEASRKIADIINVDDHSHEATDLYRDVDRLQSLAQASIDEAKRFLGEIGEEAEERIEMWSEESVESVDLQSYFTSTTGLLLSSAYYAVGDRAKEQSLKVFTKEIEGAHDYDWSKGLADMLNEGKEA